MLTTRYILDEAHLSHYDERLKSWASSQPVKTIPSTLYPWTLTAKAGAVTCWPVGATPLKPTVDFMFTETPPASGDKGPENPSTISGVSSVKTGRVGRNLLLKAPPTYSPNPSPVTITQNTDGTYILNGTNNTNNIIYVAITDSAYAFSGSKSSVVLNSAKSYTMSGTMISGSYTAGPTNSTYSFGYSSNNGYYSSASLPLSGKTSFTLASKPDADGKFIARMNISPGSTFANAVFAFQLEEGAEATGFESPVLPADANNTIALGNTYYGGSIDLATGVMTVTHVAVTPDASTVDISSAPAALPLDYADTFGRTITSADGTSLVVGSTGGTVVYKLATPQTVQLTPTEILSLTQADKYTPRLNTIYTDASSVQVGYVKSPIREEYELQQAIMAQGGNI